MSKSRNISWNSPLIVSVLLFVLVISASFVVTHFINEHERDYAYSRLSNEASNLATTILDEMTAERTQLEVLASLAATYDTLGTAEFAEILASFHPTSSMSHIELLLPNDTVITSEGRRIDVSGFMSFATEADHGTHVSNRMADTVDHSRYVVRNFVPVIKNGETVAMLYGVVDVGAYPESLVSQSYDDQASIYVIDGNTGDFLLDTWHNDTGGNIWALGERHMAPGFDHDQMRKDLTEGKSGYVVFVSETTGSNLYLFFTPVGINNWQVALSVPEDVVLDRANDIRGALYLFVLFEAACFIFYFFWIIRRTRKETAEKQSQLDTVNYIYEVEKLLFNAHENQDRVSLALAKIGQVTQSHRVALWIMEGQTPTICYIWDAPSGHLEPHAPANADPGGPRVRVEEESGTHLVPSEDDRKVLLFLMSRLVKDNLNFVELTQEDLQREFSGIVPEAMQMIALPLRDTDGSIRGILTVRNRERTQASYSLLRSVQLSLGMFCRNLRTHRIIKTRGEVDALTGLYNRNRFEQDRLHYAKRHRGMLSCFYIDLNGLHELNNTEGHRAGDQALAAVSRQIKDHVGDRHAYRIGGDEFVVFVPDVTRLQAEQIAREIQQHLADAEVSVSVGVSWQEKDADIDELIVAAEEQMYVEKSSFYRSGTHERHTPRGDSAQ